MVDEKPVRALKFGAILKQVSHKNSPKLSKITFLLIYFDLYLMVNSIGEKGPVIGPVEGSQTGRFERCTAQPMTLISNDFLLQRPFAVEAFAGPWGA
jgi:hypothetical protein